MSAKREERGVDRTIDRAADRSAGPPALEAVLLDVDGTLVDSNDAHAEAWSDVLREAGHDIGSERVRPLIGMGGDKILPELIGVDSESEEGKRLSARRTEVFLHEYLPAILPFAHARDLLERMRDDGYRLVIATSALDEELRGLMKVVDAEWLIDEKTSSSDAENSKPDSDIIHAALEKAGAPARACLMLGDTPYDVAAATKAGVRIVALRCGGWSDDELRGAIAVYEDPSELYEKYDESPFGRGAGRGEDAAGSERRSGAERNAAVERDMHGEGDARA